MLLILAATLLLAVAGSHGFAGYQRLRKIDPANIDPSLMTVLIPVMLNREYFHDPQTLKDITGDYVPTGPLKGMTSTNAKRKFKNRLLNKRHYKNKRGFYISDEPQSYHRPYRSSSLYRSLNTERFKLERPYEEEDEYERRPRETLRYRYRNNYNTGPVDHYVYDKRSLNEDAYNTDQPLKASGINQEEPYEEDEEYSRRPKQIQRYRSLDEGDYNIDQPLKARRINEEEPYEEDEEYSRPKQIQRYRTLYQDGYNSDQALKARRINTGYPLEEEEEDERPREIQRYRYRTNYLTGHGHHYAYHKRFREY